MKRLIAASFLIISIVTAYIIGYFYIDKTCEKTNKLLEKCVIAYKNGEEVKEKSEKLENYWSEREDTLSVFLNHNSIDEIELAIHSLKVHSKEEKNEMFYEYSGKIKILLHQVMEDTKPGIHSIL